jgi:hypothetical protein
MTYLRWEVELFFFTKEELKYLYMNNKQFLSYFGKPQYAIARAQGRDDGRMNK